MTKSKQLFIAILLVLSFTPFLVARAQTESSETAPVTTLNLSAAIQALADETFGSVGMTEEGTNEKIQGAAMVTVVQNGKIIFSQGYGAANARTGAAIDLDKTVFRIGSITKTFTAILALQLIEEGLIDPNKNINEYLINFGVQIADRFSEPVTVNDLLNLRAGRFDYSFNHVFVSGETSMQADDNGLVMPKDEVSRRLWRSKKPGGVSAYDNWGVGLLGYTLTAATRKSYAELVEERIFAPLKMKHSMVGVPRSRVGEILGCYGEDPYNSELACAYDRIFDIASAAGSIGVSAHDMGRYMSALLGGGELEGQRILSPEMFAQLTDFDSNRIDPRLPAFGRLLYESFQDNRYSMAHSGSTGRFMNYMHLYPESGIGLWVAVQTGLDWENGGVKMPRSLSDAVRGVGPKRVRGKTYEKAIRAFKSKFAETLIPAPVLDIDLSDIEELELQNISGVYRRVIQTGLRPLLMQMLERIAFSKFEVSVNSDDTLTIRGRRQAAGKYHKNGVNQYLNDESERELVFVAPAVANNSEGIYANFRDGQAPTFFEKMPWHYSAKFSIYPLFASLLVLLTTGIYWCFRRSNCYVRRTMGFAFVGGLLVLLGVLAELEFSITHLYHRGDYLLAILWRSILHLGLLVLLAVPIYTLFSMRWLGLSSQSVEVLKSSRLAIVDTTYLFLVNLSLVLTWVLCFYWGLIGRFIS